MYTEPVRSVWPFTPVRYSVSALADTAKPRAKANRVTKKSFFKEINMTASFWFKISDILYFYML
jgi:hypothetical protein